jgi:hypothetical protein
MFLKEILSKTRWICLDCVWFDYGVAGCIGLAYGFAQMYICEERWMQVVLHFVSIDGTHGGSSRSVACMKVARLERSLECWRREGINELLFQAYTRQRLPAGDFPFIMPRCSQKEPAQGIRSHGCPEKLPGPRPNRSLIYSMSPVQHSVSKLQTLPPMVR